ncbi:hypothetical protein [Streptomyces sp. NPDC058371]|uniref:hypothetical protein n=1 Tax=Streptomyces sp. NPDC058371 TaxID=3346463 RepID=UPI0036670CC0
MGAQPRVRVYWYSQTGQLLESVCAVTDPLEKAGWDVRKVEIRPREPFAFPWPLRRFFGVFPACVDPDGAPGITVRPPVAEDDDADLVVFAFPVWYLAPALPMRALIDAEPQAFEGRAVIGLVACRNMWYSAALEVQRLLGAAGGRYVGTIAAVDTASAAVTFVTQLRWLLAGRREASWGFSRAGVGNDELDRLALLGERLAQLAPAQSEPAPQQGDLASAQGVLASAQGDLAPQQGDLASAQGVLASAQGDLASQQGELARAQSDLASVPPHLASQQGDLAPAQGELARAQSDLASVPPHLAPQQGDLAPVQGELASQQGDLASVPPHLAPQQGDLAPAQDELASQQGEFVSRAVGEEALEEVLAEGVRAVLAAHDAAPVHYALAAADLLAGKVFRVWGRVIRAAGRRGEAQRAALTGVFVLWLTGAVLAGLPAVAVARVLVRAGFDAAVARRLAPVVAALTEVRS